MEPLLYICYYLCKKSFLHTIIIVTSDLERALNVEIVSEEVVKQTRNQFNTISKSKGCLSSLVTLNSDISEVLYRGDYLYDLSVSYSWSRHYLQDLDRTHRKHPGEAYNEIRMKIQRRNSA